MSQRARSESPLVVEFWADSSRTEQNPLFSATMARKRVEQDSLLLANRIRLLRAEEDKTRKKIRETEQKTQEIVELRRRNEERRLAREAEEARRDAVEQELRDRQLREREELQLKLQMRQRILLEQKVDMSSEARHEREARRQAIEAQREEAEAEILAKRERVRTSLAAATRSRSKSESAKQELARDAARERALREEEERRACATDISRMEREEAELLQRLQLSQERHRMAFLRLEDALRQSGLSHAGGSVSSAHGPPLVAEGRRQLTSSPCGGSVGGASSGSTGHDGKMGGPSPGAAGSARPPRPRGVPSAGLAAASTEAGAAARPDSAPKASTRRRPPCPPCAGSASSCSTASGADSGCGGAGSGRSTPSSASTLQITYTTVDGLQLHIPAEDDLDLAGLLSG